MIALIITIALVWIAVSFYFLGAYILFRAKKNQERDPIEITFTNEKKADK